VVEIKNKLEPLNVILEMISAKENIGVEELKTNYCLCQYRILRNNETIVTNTRHRLLTKKLEEVTKVKYD
jgi:tRNA modification GTPase